MSLVSLAVLTLCLTWLIHFLYHRYQLFQTFARLNIPGPVCHSITGHISFKDRNYYFKQFAIWFSTYGDYFGYYRGDRPVLVIRRPDMIQEVLTRRFKQFPNRLRFTLDTKPFNASILALRDGEWRRVRKTIAPAFTSMQMSKCSIRETIFTSIQQLDKVLQTGSMSRIVERKQDNHKLVVNASNLAACFTFEVILKIAFALETTDILERDDSHLMTIMDEFMHDLENPLIKGSQFLPFLKPILEFIGTYLSSGKIIDLLVKQLKANINDYQQNRAEVVQERSKKSILMDYILQRTAQGDLSEEEAIGNLMVILMAGYETTAICLGFTLFLLAQHPQIQTRLRGELIHFFATAGVDDPQNFYKPREEQEALEVRVELLDRIIYESMRLYPPVTDFVFREISDQLSQVRLESEPSVVVPSSVAIQVPIWPIHHDPCHWPDPFTFNPDRPDLPIPGASSEQKNPLFVAFGLGQRSCIGGNLALAELRHLLAALVLNYNIDLLEANDHFHGYSIHDNGMLEIQGNAEMIQPVSPIKLLFSRIEFS